MDDKTLEMTMLIRFLRRPARRRNRGTYFDLYYNDDLSLAEIAEQAGISRQGVRDIIMRAEHILLDYESKTGIVCRFPEPAGGHKLQLERDLSAI